MTDVTAAPRGKGTTFFAVTVDEGPVVVKWYAGDDHGVAERVARSDELLRRGHPTARTLVHGPSCGGYALVQERLPGVPAVRGPGPETLRELRAAVELQAGAGEESAGGECWIAAAVRDDAMGWWAAARARSARAARLCDRLGAWLASAPAPEPRADLVFGDLNFTNVLVAGDRLSGIVDIDLLNAGDRCLDLARLAFEYELLRDDELLRGGDGRIAGHRDDPVDVLAEDVLRISGRGGWRQAVAFIAVARLGWRPSGGGRDPQEPTLRATERLMGKPYG
ncbi:phosphotransferase family protein [Streptomyces sp. XH2]|uniref:phosphotransferase family protein n=1 Tax=Streptomyces sp. XH2 TaxID=3412483 RepID=UPI003C7B473E